VAEHRPRIATTPEEHRRVLTQFMQAMASGDLSGLMQLMASDVASYSDGGGKASAATRPLFGADRVARFLVGLATQGVRWGAETVMANGRESVMIRADGQTPTFLTLDVVGGRVQAVYFVRNPDKLARLDRPRIP
jgi:RNA polymerase sigma-70 factor (ECF subfamily)